LCFFFFPEKAAATSTQKEMKIILVYCLLVNLPCSTES